MMRVALIVAVLLVAGCADPAPVEEEEDNGLEVEVDDQTGAIRGVVVDQAIVPVAEAKVILSSVDPVREAITDKEGRFAFSKVPPGAHELDVSKLVHEPVKASVVVVAGDPHPQAVRIQLVRLYDQTPFITDERHEGHFGCAYNFFISTTCVNDYTRINPTGHCPGGCFPQLASLLDDREFITQLSSGWQTFQAELVWEPSLVGTANTMGMTVSYFARPVATHYWYSGSGEAPLVGRVQLGVEHPSANTPSNTMQEIPPEGIDDLFIFMAAGNGQVAIEQQFEVFFFTSYYAPLPEGWSFTKGDEYPF